MASIPNPRKCPPQVRLCFQGFVLLNCSLGRQQVVIVLQGQLNGVVERDFDRPLRRRGNLSTSHRRGSGIQQR